MKGCHLKFEKLQIIDRGEMHKQNKYIFVNFDTKCVMGVQAIRVVSSIMS